MDKPIIYLLSGIGSDERVFQFLRLNASKVVPIKWIKPIPTETLHEYAIRISPQIDTSKPVILVGVSFGGIVSMELNKIIKVEKTFIISSAKTPAEFPFYFPLARKTMIYKLLPVGTLKKMYPLMRFIFGSKKNKEFEILKGVIRESDNDLLRWTIREVLKWNNDKIPDSLYHIHGTNDLLFPIRNIKNAIKIEKGTHIMIMNRAIEIAEIINNLLKESNSPKPKNPRFFNTSNNF